MKYAIFYKSYRIKATEFVEELKKYISQEHTYDEENPEYVIVVGGDGTFFECNPPLY